MLTNGSARRGTPPVTGALRAPSRTTQPPAQCRRGRASRPSGVAALRVASLQPGESLATSPYLPVACAGSEDTSPRRRASTRSRPACPARRSLPDTPACRHLRALSRRIASFVSARRRRTCRCASLSLRLRHTVAPRCHEALCVVFWRPMTASEMEACEVVTGPAVKLEGGLRPAFNDIDVEDSHSIDTRRLSWRQRMMRSVGGGCPMSGQQAALDRSRPCRGRPGSQGRA